ncbi:hypothetical protein PANA5342_2850 [Pantoea ananatis LMG 5342]|nr:hypothetical protein PANA5342_2850 [Pantoea ananatis LMG 5342]
MLSNKSNKELVEAGHLLLKRLMRMFFSRAMWLVFTKGKLILLN